MTYYIVTLTNGQRFHVSADSAAEAMGMAARNMHHTTVAYVTVGTDQWTTILLDLIRWGFVGTCAACSALVLVATFAYFLTGRNASYAHTAERN